MFEERIAQLALDHLARLRAYDRNRVLEEIAEQLTYEPTVTTTLRKQLASIVPTFEHVQPIWQLRVDDFRVIYDVSEAEATVVVRAVLRKGRRTTGEII